MLVNVGVLYLGEQWLFTRVASGAVRLDCALATAIFSATLHNFLWNRRWTWRDRVTPFPQPAWAQFARYALACWLAIGLQFILTRVLAILGASVCNFLAHDLWTFGRRRVGIAPVRGRSSGAG
jgi:putative flippase GtrA